MQISKSKGHPAAGTGSEPYSLAEVLNNGAPRGRNESRTKRTAREEQRKLL